MQRLCTRPSNTEGKLYEKQGQAGGRKGQETSCLWIDVHHCSIQYLDDHSFSAESIHFQNSWQWLSYLSNDQLVSPATLPIFKFSPVRGHTRLVSRLRLLDSCLHTFICICTQVYAHNYIRKASNILVL